MDTNRTPDGEGPAVSNLAEEGATGATGATSTGDSESDRGTMNVSAFVARYKETNLFVLEVGLHMHSN